MTDHHPDSLEARLRALNPVAPSDLLADRIRQSLETKPRRMTRRIWVLIPAAAAAAVCLMLVRPFPAKPAPRSSGMESWTPVYTAQEVVDRRDEGVTVLEGIGPVRTARLTVREVGVWKSDGSSGRLLAASAPREHLLFLPLSYQ